MRRQEIASPRQIEAHNDRTDKCGKMRKLRLNSRVGGIFRGRSRGFALIEVVIAMLLLGMVGMAVLTSLSYASTVLIVVDRQATAESLAQSQMESIKNEAYIDYEEDPHANYTRITAFGGYKIQPIGVSTLEEGLQKITVIVEYYILRYNISTRGSELVPRQFTLVDYKRMPLT
jgi:prepilin-type N-terminal cleavage/methylation domain-containing protein